MISVPKADVVIIDKRIVKMTIRDGSHLEIEDVIEINKIKCRLTAEKKHVVLLISGTDTSISKEARELSADNELARNRLAKAIVINSLAQRIIGNYFIRFNKSSTPVKLFKNENDALDWLRGFII